MHLTIGELASAAIALTSIGGIIGALSYALVSVASEPRELPFAGHTGGKPSGERPGKFDHYVLAPWEPPFGWAEPRCPPLPGRASAWVDNRQRITLDNLDAIERRRSFVPPDCADDDEPTQRIGEAMSGIKTTRQDALEAIRAAAKNYQTPTVRQTEFMLDEIDRLNRKVAMLTEDLEELRKAKS